MIVFISVCPVLKSVREWDALFQTGPGVQLRIADFGIVPEQAALEALDRSMHLVRFDIGLGRAAQHRDASGATAGFQHVADVGAQRFDHLGLVLGRLRVSARQPSHVFGIKCGAHRSNRAQLVGDLGQMLGREHTGRQGRCVSVLREDIPGGELELAQGRERNEARDLRHAIVRAFAEPNRAHLRERADRGGPARAGEQAASDEGGGDGAESRQKYCELAIGRLDASGGMHVPSWVGVL
jgi:hypothetical protein